MERRRLQGGLDAAVQGVHSMALDGILKQLQGQTPMTGSGVKAGNVPQPENPQPDKGDASTLGPNGQPQMQQPGQEQPNQPGDYVIPARPSVLAGESSDGHPLLQMMRRRVDNAYGPRRLG